jgi:Flp pilus assembly protein TadD
LAVDAAGAVEHLGEAIVVQAHLDFGGVWAALARALHALGRHDEATFGRRQAEALGGREDEDPRHE